jgi:hypothetical protein
VLLKGTRITFKELPVNRIHTSLIAVALFFVAVACENQDRVPTDEDLESTAQEVFSQADCPMGTPSTLAPPAEHTIKRILHARGVQRYRCDATPTGGFAWTFVEPDADLFGACAQYGTHYIGPAWEYQDGSIVTGTKIASANAPDILTSIPWLLLQASGHSGTSPGMFANVTYIQRLTTGGGLAPAASACDATSVGTIANAPYSADYFFYRYAPGTVGTNVRCGG